MLAENNYLDADGEALGGEAEGAVGDGHFGGVESDQVGDVEELVVDLTVHQRRLRERREQNNPVLTKLVLKSRKSNKLKTMCTTNKN